MRFLTGMFLDSDKYVICVVYIQCVETAEHINMSMLI